MKTVFIVTGETGALADHRDWAVTAFFEEKRASVLVEQLNRWCHENRVSPGVLPENRNQKSLNCPLDPLFRTDFNGTRYYCYSLSVKEPKDP